MKNLIIKIKKELNDSTYIKNKLKRILKFYSTFFTVLFILYLILLIKDKFNF
jgi:hypothetical protein